ncbi:MAG: hypothetical protein IT196_24905 [Acidimicrobiales bacterium]|nr:hypothetical protein [Acidimicrobiales bacterium]
MDVRQPNPQAHTPTGADSADSAAVAVVVLRWPEEDARRRWLAAAGIPRILVLPAEQPPPSHWDHIEDWVREPVDPEELEVRRVTVALRRSMEQGRRTPVELPQPDGAPGPRA